MTTVSYDIDQQEINKLAHKIFNSIPSQTTTMLCACAAAQVVAHMIGITFMTADDRRHALDTLTQTMARMMEHVATETRETGLGPRH